jgi:TRAP-type C4-dicarboxylate transport system permease small subunit
MPGPGPAVTPRRLLDGLYAAAAGLAALSLLSIFVVMIAQIVLREMGRQLPGADDLSAYLCVATTFLALAATFRRGEIIRVSMVLNHLRPGPRRAMEILTLTLAACVMAYVTWWTAQEALFAWEIEEVAQGTVAFPLWVPKLVMPLGAGLLLVAILDELAATLRGATPSYIRAAAERAAAGDYTKEP